LRLFVDCTTDDDEKRRLEELCSKEGSEVYIKYVLEEHLSILDILNHFPSCQPDVAMLIGKNTDGINCFLFNYFIQNIYHH
jgi:methionine synthase reductase